jgi:predicted nuclease of predicted toxin-antitoxin system
MRILLDECVDQRLRRELPEHRCETARFAGFAGLKNGILLSAAEAAGFEVMITTDQEIPFQQNLNDRKLAMLILCADSNRLASLRQLLPEVKRALCDIRPGQVVRVPSAGDPGANTIYS